MPYTIPAITTPKLSRWKSHTTISEWQIHTQEHSWYRTTTILRSFAGVSADSTVAAGTAARTHCLGCCCCCCYFHSSVTYGPTLFILIYFISAHRRRRCGVGCRGCCRGENHLRMSAPPVRCRLLALEYKPRSPSPARPPRRHDFARHRTDCQPPNSGHTCLFWGSLWLSKQPHKLFNTIKIVRIIFTHHLL